MTAAVVAAEAEAGRLGLDDPLSRHVRPPGCPAFDEITLADLVHHTSGVGSALAVLDQGARGPVSATDAVDQGAPVLCAGGEPGRYRYSSANYLLLAAALESATGSTFAELVRRHVSEPSGAGGVVADSDDAADVPRGHRILFGQAVPLETPYDRAGVAYGYLGGSLLDLEAVASAFLRGDTGSGDPLADGGVAASSGERYGAGWRIRDLPDGTRMAWHSGMVAGYFTTVMLWPERDLGLVTMQNLSGPWHAGALLSGPMQLGSQLTGVDLGGSTESVVYPVVVGSATFVAALTVLAAFAAWRRVPGRRARVAWSAAVLASAAPAAWAAFSGIPVRQVWFWVPDVALLAALVVLAVLAGCAAAWLRPASPDMPAQRTAARAGVAARLG